MEHTHHHEHENASTKNDKGILAYYPIFLIAAYIILVATINNFRSGIMN